MFVQSFTIEFIAVGIRKKPRLKKKDNKMRGEKTFEFFWSIKWSHCHVNKTTKKKISKKGIFFAYHFLNTQIFFSFLFKLIVETILFFYRMGSLRVRRAVFTSSTYNFLLNEQFVEYFVTQHCIECGNAYACTMWCHGNGRLFRFVKQYIFGALLLNFFFFFCSTVTGHTPIVMIPLENGT